jgi:hypothetical protein
MSVDTTERRQLPAAPTRGAPASEHVLSREHGTNSNAVAEGAVMMKEAAATANLRARRLIVALSIFFLSTPT